MAASAPEPEAGGRGQCQCHSVEPAGHPVAGLGTTPCTPPACTQDWPPAAEPQAQRREPRLHRPLTRDLLVVPQFPHRSITLPAKSPGEDHVGGRPQMPSPCWEMAVLAPGC